MILQKTSIFLLSILLVCQASANNKLDSLRQQYRNSSNVELRIDALEKLTNEFSANNYDSAIFYSDLGIGLAIRENYKKGLAAIMLNRGNTHMYFSELNKSLEWYKKCTEIAQKNNLKWTLAKGFNNIGIVYDTQSNHDKALQYYQRSVQLKKELGKLKSLKSTYLNIGGIFVTLGDYESGLKYFTKSEQISRAYNDTLGMSHVLINKAIILIKLQRYREAITLLKEAEKHALELNIQKEVANCYNTTAVAYFNLEKPDSAMHFYQLSLEAANQIGDSITISKVMSNMADIHYSEGELDKAKVLATEALRIKIITKDTRGQALTKVILARIHIDLGEFSMAKQHLDEAYDLVHDAGYIDELVKVYEIYRKYYFELKDFKNAFTYYDLYQNLEDSLRGKETIQRLHAIELRSEREKQETKINLLEKDKELAKVNLEKSNLLTYSFAAGGGLVLILGLVALRAYVRKKKDNELINEQKDLVENQKIALEEKNTSITDSIRYAKRLQEAIIPPIAVVNEYLDNAFILYKPKDIVAGDFYWIKKIGSSVLFAVADCTGHGVPGAILSVVCHNALNRAVGEFNITEPAKILDKVSAIVEETFAKSEKDVHDGMDIALCLLNKEKMELQFSGAHNALYQIRNGEFQEFKGARQPIPKIDKEKPFSNETIALQKDDLYYIFSDGYADQFGGVNGRKLKYKPFQELLLRNSSLPMEDQLVELDSFFESWRGDEDQVDDVCLMGYRV